MKEIKDYDPKEYIIVKGAKLNNLKNIDVLIPRNKLTVFTGLSGSGKSTLAFDTVYAEGQRRYVESLSSYVRQFMGRHNKPKVDYIKGLSPSIAIQQKINNTNPRSTVGTKTEIYDYLKLLYSRIGKTFSPVSGKEVKKDTVESVIDYIKSSISKQKYLLLAPFYIDKTKSLVNQIKTLKQQGYVRIFVKNKIIDIDNIIDESIDSIDIVIDRFILKKNSDFYKELSDSVEIAFYEGKGNCSLFNLNDNKRTNFSNKFELDGIKFLNPNIHFFNFNNPYGACKKCSGYGDIIDIDIDLVIPNKTLSIFDHAIVPWRGNSYKKYYKKLIDNSHKFNFPIHKPIHELKQNEIKTLWEGNSHFIGIKEFFRKIKAKSYKIQNRVLLSRYRGKTKCSDCNGSRLRKETNYVKISNMTLSDLLNQSIINLQNYFTSINLSKNEKEISSTILIEIKNRLQYLNDVGLGYLTLNRKSNTLSGGESQRIQLAASLGSNLVGSIYVLDEPSVGLHSKDTENLIKVLIKLRDLGNTIIVVEHDESIIKSADYIIDIGPYAGSLGGEINAYGTLSEFLKKETLTSKYLSGNLKIVKKKQKETSESFLYLKGARENNLKNIDVKFPLDCLTLITGISGSGKTTLVKNILYPTLQRRFGNYSSKPGDFSSLEGNFDKLKGVEYVDQNPIGKSSRSNPVTYIKVYDDIRNLFASLELSKIRNYKPKHFSFNVDGGRCENCKGEGSLTIEMQFMADVVVECNECKGTRFKNEICEVQYNGKSINELLNMTVDDSIVFFQSNNENKIAQKLKPLSDVGLGYVTLGQSSSTLSGGEAQRIKLASFLSNRNFENNILFIFDEPTTGLHFHDINKLVNSFYHLIEKGHSVIVVEHNIDLIKIADHIIDLGPEAGEKGGEIIAEGNLKKIINNKKSFTGKYLLKQLN